MEDNKQIVFGCASIVVAFVVAVLLAAVMIGLGAGIIVWIVMQFIHVQT